jgi:nucleoside phosphorylase
MIPEYTIIPRTIDELTRFLERNKYTYQSAYDNIRPHKGWIIPFPEKYFEVMNSLYGMLYINLYEKFQEDYNLPDDDILNAVNGFVDWADKETKELNKLATLLEFGILAGIDGHVYHLLYKAFNKFKQLIQIALEEKKINEAYKITSDRRQPKFKIGIVTVTDEEHKAALDILSDIKIVLGHDNDAFSYRSGFIKGDGKKISVILVQCLHQGAAASAVATTQLINKFSPENLVMLGHAAGNKGKMKGCGIGDIMIAAEAIDYEKKTITEKKSATNQPEIIKIYKVRPLYANSSLVSQVKQFKGGKGVLDAIRQGYEGHEKFPIKLKLFPGAILSGGALVRSGTWFNELIKGNPGAIGLDMEIYGFYYAAENTTLGNKPKCIAIKSISDYGSDNSKYANEIEDHTVRVPYACYTSAEFLKRFALTNIR